MADEDKKTEEQPAAPAEPDAHTNASTGEKINAAPVADPDKPTIAVKVYAPFQVFFEGQAISVTGVNETGPFDILPHHRNFLCMLVPSELVIRTPYEEKRIKVSRALMHVKADKITVFVDV
jgi:hypothetical protein